jgi:hypothetical protein
MCPKNIYTHKVNIPYYNVYTPPPPHTHTHTLYTVLLENLVFDTCVCVRAHVCVRAYACV